MSKTANPLHYHSLLEVADQIRTSQISPVELTRITLERIHGLDPKLHSFAHLSEELAIEAARQAEQEIQQGNYRGPLHGIPLAVKDLCFTRGIPTRGGLRVLKNFVPDYDATVISKLKSAGAVLLGKLSLTEGAVGGYHPDYPIPRNPWGETLWTGSSSSGSGVAVAAGLCFGALGSDTGGSIRFPAMACGIVGLKPTYGRVSRHGILPLAESLDHVGPMARTVADSAVLLQAVAGYDPRDNTSLQVETPGMLNTPDTGLEGVRLGFDSIYASASIDKNLSSAIMTALDQFTNLGAQIVEVSVPDTSEIRDIWKIICTYEAARAHAENYPSRASDYGEFFREFLETGADVRDQEYRQASLARIEFNQQFYNALSNIDALICPGGGIPFEVTPGLLYKSMSEIRSFMNPYTYFQFTIPANFSGLPSLSLPCGISEKDLLYTMQLVGNQLSEMQLCRIGHAYEQSTTWHRYHPPLLSD